MGVTLALPAPRIKAYNREPDYSQKEGRGELFYYR
jgi:hypothetical protein